jgi:putative FmdB family regulatory protein
VPTYQYACTACEHRFEAVQAFTDSALTECPECAGRLRKLYGSVGVVFKGSGFYRNDSRNGATAKEPAAKKEKESAGTDSTKPTASPSKDSGTSSSSSSASTSTPAAKAS